MFCIYAFVNWVAVMMENNILTDKPSRKFLDIFNAVIGATLGLNFADKEVE
jgi:hypothetical protein